MAWLCAAGGLALLYVYGAYPLLLRLIVRLRGPKPVRSRDITPSISFLISAYNEAPIIRAKIENTLSLDYPRELLEIVVISDASTDGTDDIVREYEGRGVILARQPARQGKTAGLNATVGRATGELVVFSDANAMYQRDALRALARNFADPEVGCAVGEARYLPGTLAAAEAGERAYWGYEMRIKRLETALGSMVGGDGAIYAIRRSLWQPLPRHAINDFLNPLQIVAAGWRVVYEPGAVCYEETAGSIAAEYRRRIRIVSRSWRAVFQCPEVLNPIRAGLFTWCLVSHKILRWFSGAFAALAAIGALGLYLPLFQPWHGLVMAGLAACAVMLPVRSPLWRRAAGMGVYYALISAASLAGILKGSAGRVSGVWTTARHDSLGAARPAGISGERAALQTVPVGTIFLVLAALLIAGWVAALIASRPIAVGKLVPRVAKPGVQADGVPIFHDRFRITPRNREPVCDADVLDLVDVWVTCTSATGGHQRHGEQPRSLSCHDVSQVVAGKPGGKVRGGPVGVRSVRKQSRRSVSPAATSGHESQRDEASAKQGKRYRFRNAPSDSVGCGPPAINRSGPCRRDTRHRVRRIANWGDGQKTFRDQID